MEYPSFQLRCSSENNMVVFSLSLPLAETNTCISNRSNASSVFRSLTPPLESASNCLNNKKRLSLPMLHFNSIPSLSPKLRLAALSLAHCVEAALDGGDRAIRTTGAAGLVPQPSAGVTGHRGIGGFTHLARDVLGCK